MAKIWVIGSANADLILAVSVLPNPVETVRGRDFVVAPGGKGTNQAVAAARLGGDVSFVGCIGDDDFGRSLRASLSDSGVDVTHLKVAPSVASGIAMVMTETSGENSIAISGGANDLLLPDDIDALSALIGQAAILSASSKCRSRLSRGRWRWQSRITFQSCSTPRRRVAGRPPLPGPQPTRTCVPYRERDGTP